MLDQISIFTKGGVLLWTKTFAAVRGDPVNTLIRTCLLEDRTGDSSFAYTAPLGGSYTIKWLFNNSLGLIYVAVYQKALKLTYIDELLRRVDKAFCKVDDVRNLEELQNFDGYFVRLLREVEEKNDYSKKADTTRVAAVEPARGDGSEEGPPPLNPSPQETRPELVDETTAAKGTGEGVAEKDLNGVEDADHAAFNAAILSKRFGKKPGQKKQEEATKKKITSKEKKARSWSSWGAVEEKVSESELDFTDGVPPAKDKEVLKETFNKMSLVDVEEHVDQEGEVHGDSTDGQKGAGLLSSFVRNLGVSVLGTQALTHEDIDSSLQELKRKLMERNVAEEIANKVIESVAATVVGKKLGSFTRVSSAIKQAVEESLTRILTPKKSIDIIRDVKEAKARGKPYVIVFVGVNGVGKSTNLAKVAYWLLQNNLKIMIAACDTFRSGAVEQLKTHCTRLGVPLYERGYEKDPAKVAFEATKAAQKSGCDVVLVDTAGRMQDNEPLMRALSNLISFNSPDLVLFVGEALVGNDAVDQLTKFNKRLADLAPGPDPHLIDGIVLTKFDTIDEKVGAALSMVYTMHAGAGYHSEKRHGAYQKVMRTACKEAARSLEEGRHILEALSMAISVLEKSPYTNAARGSNLTIEGRVECDASAVSSEGLCGSVAAAPGVESPIRVAVEIAMRSCRRLSLGRVPPIMLAGHAVRKWASEQGLQGIITADQSEKMHVTRRSKARYCKYMGMLGCDVNPHVPGHTEAAYQGDRLSDTVGCIIVQENGETASGVSSGGIALKQSGRVGEAAILGAGAWAEHTLEENEITRSCACSVTGVGERIIKHSIAKLCCCTACNGSDFQDGENASDEAAGRGIEMSQRCLNLLKENLESEPKPHDCGVLLANTIRSENVVRVHLSACHFASSSMAIGYLYVASGACGHGEHILVSEPGKTTGRTFDLGISWSRGSVH
eukprot:jgi/Picsp_1/6545/NSC_03888-R1_signal recognition particle receptor